MPSIRALTFIGTLLATLVSIAALAPATRAMAPATCASLATLPLPHTTITTATSVPAGPLASPTGASLGNMPAFCQVNGTIKPAPDSDIRFELWMPATGWNHKFQGLGNGGFAGSLDRNNLAAALAQGYAVAATDTGHAAGTLDAAWALGHPDKVVDFGYRAIHETAVAAKALVTAFYGEDPRRAYFNSCSNGGRQALMEAQRYPADYDGIVAGAPANFWTHLLTEAVWDLRIETDPAARVSAAKLPVIEASVLKACDALDGVEDGVIENPARCTFEPRALLCPAEETDACLTPAQVAGLSRLLSGGRTSASALVFPGHQFGGMTGGGGWSSWVTGASVTALSVGAQFGIGFFKNMVYERATWDPATFDLDRDLTAADLKLAASLNATDPDLQRFAARGGKLIMYHGWSDPAISAVNSIDYYKSVVATMGQKPALDFVRLFMVPGLQHCTGGPGPTVFGQNAASTGDRQHEIGAALEAWVEEGTAPAQIIATKFKTGTNPASGVLRTRPLCPYPQEAQWKGTGSTDDAANFVCGVR